MALRPEQSRGDAWGVCDPEAERVTLGWLLLHPDQIPNVQLTPAEFGVDSHREIFRAAVYLAAEGEPVTVSTLGDLLEKRGKLAGLLVRGESGRDAIEELKSGLPELRDKRLREQRAAREAHAFARQLAEASERGNIPDALAAAQSAAEALGSAVPREKAEHPIRSQWISAGDLQALTAEPPPRAWLFRRPDPETNGETSVGVLASGKTGLIVSPGGAGKTFAIIGAGLAVATARKWLGIFEPCRTGSVLLALAEEDAEEAHRRMFAVGRSMRLTDEQIEAAARRIVVLPLAGFPVALVDGLGAETEALTTLREMLGTRDDWALIVLDPLSRFAGPETEKDNAAATRFMQAAESLTKAGGGPAVLIAHHTNKASRAEATRTGPSASNARGASGLTDGARWVAELESLGDGAARLTITKSNYAPCGAPVDLVREDGYLRALSTEERKTWEEARATASEGQRDAAFEALQERICEALAKQPGLSKARLEPLVKARTQNVGRAVNALLASGRVIESPTNRYGYELASQKGAAVAAE